MCLQLQKTDGNIILDYDQYNDNCKIYQNGTMSISIMSRYGMH